MFYSEVWQRGVRVGGAAQVVRQWSVMLDALSENAYMAGALLSAPPASAGLCHLACCERSFPTPVAPTARGSSVWPACRADRPALLEACLRIHGDAGLVSD